MAGRNFFSDLTQSELSAFFPLQDFTSRKAFKCFASRNQLIQHLIISNIFGVARGHGAEDFRAGFVY